MSLKVGSPKTAIKGMPSDNILCTKNNNSGASGVLNWHLSLDFTRRISEQHTTGEDSVTLDDTPNPFFGLKYV